MTVADMRRLISDLGYEPHQEPPGGVGNTRNGSTPKTLITEHGEVPKVVLLQNHGLIALGKSPSEVENITAMAVNWQAAVIVAIGVVVVLLLLLIYVTYNDIYRSFFS